MMVEKKDFNVVIGGQNVFDQPVKNNLIRYNIQLRNWLSIRL